MDDQWPHWATHLFNQGAAILAGQQTLFLQGREQLQALDRIEKKLDDPNAQAKIDEVAALIADARLKLGESQSKLQDALNQSN